MAICRCKTSDHCKAIKDELLVEINKIKSEIENISISSLMNKILKKDENNQRIIANVNTNVDFSEVITIPIIFHICCPVASPHSNFGINLDTDIDLFIDKLNKAYTCDTSKFNYFNKTVPQLTAEVFNNNALHAQQYYDYIHNKSHALPVKFVKNKVIQTGKNIHTTADGDNIVKINGSPVQYADGYAQSRTLNIWFVTFTDGTLGYAQFPSDQKLRPQTDGVVISWNTIKPGMDPSMSSAYSDNKTAAHEIGHWLGLYHVFQTDIGPSDGLALNYENTNDQNQFSGDDVVDTPQQITPTYGNPFITNQWPLYRNNLCMFMNYMDYVDDCAMFMFTHDQVMKILIFIHLFRS